MGIPQNTQEDNTIGVSAAHIDPRGIAGEVSGVNGGVVAFSVPASTGIFEEGAKFNVTLALRLPKNTSDLQETLVEEDTRGKRVVIVHGSSVDNGGSNSNFWFTTTYENSVMGKGRVTFSEVDFKGRTATAHFSLSTKIL